MPLWMSILPPLVAILMALILKEVISSLFFGILTGTFIMALYGGCGPYEAFGSGLLRVVDTYIVGSLYDSDHVKIIRIATKGGRMDIHKGILRQNFPQKYNFFIIFNKTNNFGLIFAA